jgi:hypothetical protein
VSAAGDAVSCVPATKLGAPRLRVVQRRRLGPGRARRRARRPRGAAAGRVRRDGAHYRGGRGGALIAAVLTVLTGAFPGPLFKDLPQATLGAIVVVAVASFVDYRELARLARLRHSAILRSLILVIQRLSRLTVAVLARDPASGRWGNAGRNPGWEPVPGVLVIGAEGPVFSANAQAVRDRFRALLEAAGDAAAVRPCRPSSDRAHRRRGRERTGARASRRRRGRRAAAASMRTAGRRTSRAPRRRR